MLAITAAAADVAPVASGGCAVVVKRGTAARTLRAGHARQTIFHAGAPETRAAEQGHMASDCNSASPSAHNPTNKAPWRWRLCRHPRHPPSLHPQNRAAVPTRVDWRRRPPKQCAASPRNPPTPRRPPNVAPQGWATRSMTASARPLALAARLPRRFCGGGDVGTGGGRRHRDYSFERRRRRANIGAAAVKQRDQHARKTPKHPRRPRTRATARGQTSDDSTSTPTPLRM